MTTDGDIQTRLAIVEEKLKMLSVLAKKIDEIHDAIYKNGLRDEVRRNTEFRLSKQGKTQFSAFIRTVAAALTVMILGAIGSALWFYFANKAAIEKLLENAVK